MNGKILSVVSMFMASFVVGYNMLSPTQTIQATPPVYVSPIELINSMKIDQPVEEIDIEVNIETQEVTVTGATGNKKVNVKTIGEIKPDTIVKWRTKTKKEIIKSDYPCVKSISKVNLDDELIPFTYE